MFTTTTPVIIIRRGHPITSTKVTHQHPPRSPIHIRQGHPLKSTTATHPHPPRSLIHTHQGDPTTSTRVTHPPRSSIHIHQGHPLTSARVTHPGRRKHLITPASFPWEWRPYRPSPGSDAPGPGTSHLRTPLTYRARGGPEARGQRPAHAPTASLSPLYHRSSLSLHPSSRSRIFPLLSLLLLFSLSLSHCTEVSYISPKKNIIYKLLSSIRG